MAQLLAQGGARCFGGLGIGLRMALHLALGLWLRAPQALANGRRIHHKTPGLQARGQGSFGSS